MGGLGEASGKGQVKVVVVVGVDLQLISQFSQDNLQQSHWSH